MDVKTKIRCGVTRRKCNQIRKISPKIERNKSLRKVSTILRKNESLRSAEEIAVLASMTDEVKEINFRICRRQRTIERSKEIEDEHLILRSKCKKLANALQHAKHLVVYTGAGISTSADIPDYRGPNGIWTLLQQGKQIGKHDLTRADPTATHMALWQLYRKRYLKFVVSQNCDGLHLRSGLPRRALSEVHGNMYVEMCRDCKPNKQYWRLFDTTERTARFSHKTGRICHHCGASLVDSIVHFGERGIAQWPLNWAGALHHAAKADVILCLGSSLKVLKKYPWLWAMDKPIKKRPAIFVVNLQWTPKDDVAELKINGKCDKVMKLVMEYLGLETPLYERFNDPIFAHTSYLSPRELHTTTQPMLTRIPKKDCSSPNKENSITDKDDLETPQKDLINSLKHLNTFEEHSEATKEPPDRLLKNHKPMEVDEDEDDCPLNMLKIKMNIPSTTTEPVDLKTETVELKPEVKTQCHNFGVIKSDETEQESSAVVRSPVVESESCLEMKDDSNRNCDTAKESNKIVDKASVKMETVDFSCTVNVKETNHFSKSEDSVSCSNLKINAIINSNLNVKSEKSVSGFNNSANKVDGISMEILAEEFERVHVEMKTSDNEIHKVSILLINKSKSPPKSCDKFQQTDPEIDRTILNESSEYKLIKKDLVPEIKAIDTGQDCNSSIKKEVPWLKQENHNDTDLDTDKVSSRIVIDTHCISKQLNGHVSISSNDSQKRSIISCEATYFGKESLSNSLRNFRRLKDIKKTLLFDHQIDPYSVGNYLDDSKSKVIPILTDGHKIKDSINSIGSDLEQPIDFSIKQKPIRDPCIRVPTFFSERSIKSSCILKVPKPPLFLSRSVPLPPKIPQLPHPNRAIDLTLPTDFPKSVNGRLKMINRNDNEKHLNNLVEAGKLDEESYIAFKRRCENLARAIIQNTLLVNHNELQHAYSGIHSIINPVPFNVQYDFKSVFNAFNFIHLGQKLMSRGKGARNTISNGNIKTVSESITKKRLSLRKRRNSFKRKDPQCKFCYEQYKSYTCQFYTGYNSDDRFEKYYNNKLVMCDCCGDSESSDDSDDDLPLLERKAKMEMKSDDSANSECNSNSSNVEDGKVLTCNSDLKNGVQISVRDNNNVEVKDLAQAGWFGKGFRKNRRRKR